MRRTGAEIIARLLERQGIRTVAGMPGGAILPLYDALHGSRIRHVLARHEQGAGFIAHGMARATGRAAVCLGTSGPGVTNLVTPIADAKLDSVPLVAITGQVPRALIGTDAFQEVDTYGLTLPICKHSFLVQRAADLLETLPRAFEIAESGRPGPVVVDVPKDVQLETVEFARWPEPWRPSAPPPCDPEPVARLAELIGSARSPALYVGGGVVAARAARELRELARRQSIPVASTLNGLGAFPSDDPLSLGMLGMHGARGTNLVLEEADLLLALGARFDDRATGKASEFCPRATVAHVDVDAAEIGKIVRPDLAIVADVGSVLRALLPLVPHDPRPLWRRRVAKLVDEFPLPLPTCDALDHPLGLVRRIAASAPGSSVVTTDVGQHQMWVAQAFPFREPRSLLTSGGLGTMGFGLPAAIGAALARSGARAICVSGDGSWLINVQELATLAELGLDVTAIVMDNRHLGLVRQQQELFYGERYSAARFERGSDFAAIARGFGVRAVDLGRADTPEAALEAALAEPGPCVVHAPIAETENVLPMVPPGAANREMIG